MRDHSTRRRRIAALILSVCAVAAAAPAAAPAATVSKAGGVVSVAAAPGEANRLLVTRWAGSYVVSDDGAPLTAGGGCQKSGQKVTCAEAGVTAVSVSTGDGDDTATNFTTTPATLVGGDGADTLTGGAGADALVGGAGADTLWSRDWAADSVSCGSEADRAYVDTRDATEPDCETVDGGAAGGGGSTGDGSTGGDLGGVDPGDEEWEDRPDDAQLVMPGGPIRVSGSGVATLQVACPAIAGGACEGVIFLYAEVAPRSRAPLATPSRRRGRVVIGRARFSVAPGETANVHVRITRRGRRVIKKSRRVKVSAQIARRGGGASKPRTVKLRPKRKPRRRR